MALGKINFTDLALLLWKSVEHFGPMQDYFKNYDKAIYQSVHAVGIISGCAVTPVSGLTVRVAAGVVLFSNGELCEVAQTDITLTTANVTNPRIDRLELAFSFANNVTVTNTISQVKQFDKVATATFAAVAGTPAGSPVIPNKTAGNISLGSVNVAANQTTLAATDIFQDDSVRDRSYKTKQQVTFAMPQTTSSVLVDIQNLVFDKNKFNQYWLKYKLSRKTDTGSSGAVQSGTLHAFINPETGDWLYSDDRKGDLDVGVEFHVVPATGKVQWLVTNLAGANHIGALTGNLETLDV